MQKSDFDRLMERYVSGEVSAEEKRKIEAWLDAMRADESGGVELSQEAEDRIFRRLTGNMTGPEENLRLLPSRRATLSQWILRVAASVVIALLSYAAWNIVDARREKLEVVSRNGVDKIILNDGSLVWLSPGGKLVYSERPGGARHATFEGHALFEVAKDPARPFILQCGGIKVEVLGTSFSIRTGVDQVELTVLTGKVNLSSPANTQGIDALPNEKAVYKADGGAEKMKVSPAEINSLILHTDYDMRFSGESMREVARRLGQKFNVKVNLSGDEIGRCRITADFTDTSLENSLVMISEVLGIRYSISGKVVTITGSGCN